MAAPISVTTSPTVSISIPIAVSATRIASGIAGSGSGARTRARSHSTSIDRAGICPGFHYRLRSSFPVFAIRSGCFLPADSARVQSVAAPARALDPHLVLKPVRTAAIPAEERVAALDPTAATRVEDLVAAQGLSAATLPAGSAAGRVSDFQTEDFREVASAYRPVPSRLTETRRSKELRSTNSA
jgi:hypothetical protein